MNIHFLEILAFTHSLIFALCQQTFTFCEKRFSLYVLITKRFWDSINVFDTPSTFSETPLTFSETPLTFSETPLTFSETPLMFFETPLMFLTFHQRFLRLLKARRARQICFFQIWVSKTGLADFSKQCYAVFFSYRRQIVH